MPGEGSRRSPSHSCSKVWEQSPEVGARWLSRGAGPQRGLTAKPGHCSLGAETCRERHRSTWAPHPSAEGVLRAVEKSGSVMGGGHNPRSTHRSLALTFPSLGGVGRGWLGGGTQCTWVNDRERSDSPTFCVHPWGTGPRMEKGNTPLPAAPWNCPLVGSGPRSGHDSHWLRGGRANTPCLPCLLTLALSIPVG